jgi:hypothetical protein
MPFYESTKICCKLLIFLLPSFLGDYKLELFFLLMDATVTYMERSLISRASRFDQCPLLYIIVSDLNPTKLSEKKLNSLLITCIHCITINSKTFSIQSVFKTIIQCTAQIHYSFHYLITSIFTNRGVDNSYIKTYYILLRSAMLLIYTHSIH